MAVILTLDGETTTVEILGRKPQLRCSVEDRYYVVYETPAETDGGGWITVNGVRHRIWRIQEGERVHLKIGNRIFSVGITDPIDAARQTTRSGEIRADMPGVIVALSCEPGSNVRAGEALLTLESMKMQITLNAPRDGIVSTVHVAINQAFQKGALLVALEPEKESSPS